jgi:type II secretory pathway pseudopilin PulG
MEINPKRNLNYSRPQFRTLIRVKGFTFIGLLMAVAIMGVALLAVGEVWSFAQKREKEQELLFVGGQFRQAIKLYYAHTPATSKLQPYPMALEDLLKDPRYPSTQRYLRRIYLDPISNSSEWGLLKNPNGSIFGVYSLAAGVPVKKGNFTTVNDAFENKTKYSDWVFKYAPLQSASSPAKTN